MSEEEPLRASYLLRLKVGIGLLVLLAIPAIVHSHAAIETLYNHPSDWVPDSIAEKAEFNEFVDHFAVTNLLIGTPEKPPVQEPNYQYKEKEYRIGR